jgi:hypothetical protein
VQFQQLLRLRPLTLFDSHLINVSKYFHLAMRSSPVFNQYVHTVVHTAYRHLREFLTARHYQNVHLMISGFENRAGAFSDAFPDAYNLNNARIYKHLR